MKIFVTRKIPFWEIVGKPLYEAGHEVVVADRNEPMQRKDLEAAVASGYDGIMTLLTDKVDAELLAKDANGQLKIVANYAVGYDNINVADCRAKNVWVTNTPSDCVNESVAEHAWALMMALTRRIVEANDFMRNAAYRGWEPEIFIGNDMVGKTMGIIGMGRIGSMVAKRAEGFGMKVISFGRNSQMSLEEVIRDSDYVTLHVPLTTETRHLVNGKNLGWFKKTAYLVNTARGPIVDEAEVAEALRAGMLAGYGADVFENEPNVYPELLQMENVVLTPHIASATVSARVDMGVIAVRNIVEALAGKQPGNAILN